MRDASRARSAARGRLPVETEPAARGVFAGLGQGAGRARDPVEKHVVEPADKGIARGERETESHDPPDNGHQAGDAQDFRFRVSLADRTEQPREDRSLAHEQLVRQRRPAEVVDLPGGTRSDRNDRFAMQGLARTTASARGDVALLIGAIADDLGDHRPGMIAAREAGAQWPLADLGFTKVDVRERSRDRDLATWNRPAEPCLSSRVPYGERVTVAGLRMIEQAEVVLKRLGFPVCRARHHHLGGEQLGAVKKYLCRIEVPEADLSRLLPLRDQILSALHDIGYVTVTIDLAGFKSGGFNAMLSNAPSTLRTT